MLFSIRRALLTRSIMCGCLLGNTSHLVRAAAHTSSVAPRTLSSYRVHFFYNDIYEVQLPNNHRFPMEKYRLVRETVQREFAGDPNVLFSPSPEATEAELSTTHCPQYVRRYLSGQLTPQEVRRTGFPWSIDHVRRSTSSVGGTVAAARALLTAGEATIIMSIETAMSLLCASHLCMPSQTIRLTATL